MKLLFKKTKKVVLFFLGFIFWVNFSFAQTPIHFFYGNDCPHCDKELEFLNNLKNTRTNFSVLKYEIWYNSENAKLLNEISKKINKPISGVPFTLIGEKAIIGFGGEKSSGQEIISALDYCNNNDCRDIITEILDKSKGLNNVVDDNIEASNIEKTDEDFPIIESSIFGTIDLKKFSLPVITIIIGALDGFNPCAMWILLFLISMLLGMKNRKRMRILGSTFILVSGGVYFLFMAAWLNLIEFLSYIVWIRAGIGVFAILGGGYNFYQYCKSSKDSGCNVVSEKKRSKIFTKIRSIVQEKSFWIALAGISILAASVNLVELLCSAGFPVVYTQILEVNNLSMLGKYAYILLYIFFFILDDLLVFFISMKTLHLTGITTKYTKYSHLIGGILMIIIGFLLVFKPAWLMFG